MTREDIATPFAGSTDEGQAPGVLGIFPAYDWVAFCWLFGGMNDLPFAFPQLCLDIKQWAIELGDPNCHARWERVTTPSPMRGGRRRRGRSSPASTRPRASGGALVSKIPIS